MPGEHDLAERFNTAVDLWNTGVALQRQRLRREHPADSPEQIAQRLTRWLQDRPGAQFGDGPAPATHDRRP
jgi:hypothetical protein